MMIPFYNAVFAISCYYAAVSFALRYPEGLDHGADPFAFALLMAAALLFAMGQSTQMRVLRLAALLLPAVAIFWNHALPGLLEYTLPWGYLVYLSYRRPRALSHYYFKSDFSHILWIFPLLFVFVLFRPERGIAALREAAPYLIIFLAAGVLLLQALRHKGEEVKGFAKHQSGQAAIFFLLCVLLTAGGLLEFLEHVVLKKILLPAGLFLINHFLALLQYISQKLLAKKPASQKKTFTDYLEYVDKLMKGEEAEPASDPQMVPELIERGEINYILVAVLAAVVAAAVIFLVLRSKAKKRVRRGGILDEREELPPLAAEGKRSRRKDAPSEVIRKNYRKFMQLTDGISHKLQAQDTTQEIQEKYIRTREVEKVLPAAQEFTAIYRLARYNGENADFSAQREGGNQSGKEGKCADFSAPETDLRHAAKRTKILLDYLKKM